MASQLPSFDVLMDLAQNNPEALEAIRQQMSEEIIQDASPGLRHKLEGINFKVNMERQRAKTPLQSCIRITALMHDSFEQMREELDVLFKPVNTPLKLLPEAGCVTSEPLATHTASNVLPFIRPGT